MSATRSPAGRRLLPVLFWAGVALAPFAALALLLGQGGGPLRVAAVLAITSVVLMGLSVMLRQDVQSLRIHVEETLLDEVDALRDDLRSEIRSELRQAVQSEVVAAMRAVQTAREREVAALRSRLEALQGQLEAPHRRRELPAGSSDTRRPAPTSKARTQTRTETAGLSPNQRVVAASTDSSPDVPRPRGAHGDTPTAGRHHAPEAPVSPAAAARSHRAIEPGSAYDTGGHHRYRDAATSYDRTAGTTGADRTHQAPPPSSRHARPDRDDWRDASPYGSAYHTPQRQPVTRQSTHRATTGDNLWDDLREERTTRLGTRRHERADSYDDENTTRLGTRHSAPAAGHRHGADDDRDDTRRDRRDQAGHDGNRSRRRRRADENRYGHLRLVQTGPDVDRHQESEPPATRPRHADTASTSDTSFWTDPLRAPMPMALPGSDSAPTWSPISPGSDRVDDSRFPEARVVDPLTDPHFGTRGRDSTSSHLPTGHWPR